MGKNNRRLLRPSFRTVLIIIPTVLSALFIAAIGVQLHFSAQKYLEDDFNSNARLGLAEASQLLQTAFSRTEKCIGIVQEDKDILGGVFAFPGMTPDQRAAVNIDVYNALLRMREIEPCIGTIIFLTDGGIVSIGSTAVSGVTPGELAAHFGLSGGVFFHEPAAPVYTDDARLSTLHSLFFFCAPIELEGKRGYACISLRENVMEYLYRDFDGLAVASGYGRVYFNSTGLPDAGYTAAAPGGASNISEDMLEHVHPTYANMRVYYLKNPTQFMSTMLGLIPLTLLFVLLTLAFAAIVSGLLSAFVTKPLRRLAGQIAVMDPTKPGASAPSEGLAPEHARRGRQNKVSGQQILYYLLVMVLVPVTLYSVISVSLYSSLVKDTVTGQLKSSFDRAASEAGRFIRNIKESSISFAFNDAICDTLITGRELPENLKAAFPYMSARFDHDADLAIYDTSKRLLRRTDETMSDTTDAADQPASNQLWSIDERSGTGRYLTFSLGINHLFPYERIGYFKARVDEVLLRRCYEQFLSSSTRCWIYSADGQIISHSDEALIGTYIDDPSDAPGTFSYTARLEDEDFHLRAQYDDALVTGYVISFFQNTLYMFIIILLAILVISSALSHYLVLSFHNFSKRLSGINVSGDEVVTNDRSFIREINELNTTFQAMSRRIRALMDDAIAASERQHELIISRQRAESAMLQAQINPHFLYNAFESINFMIRMKDEQRAISMISSLSSMLRFVAKLDEQFVPLEDELQYASMYVNIMKMRFRDVLSVTFDFYDADLSLSVVKFILQPIIENAIYHGIKPKGAPGRVLVSGETAGGTLIITVRDDGVGMSAQQLERLTASLGENKPGGGIGLSNVHHRLRSTFGDAYGLAIMSSPGKGTVVTISHPCIRSGRENKKQGSF